MSIPKIIHYCWFGNNPKPTIIKRCIQSWRKYCPDFEIIEWNENNFDVNCLPFCRQAYEAKQWAFVTDYVRLKVLYDFGGIYMDTDVELFKPLYGFLDYSCFMGFQHEHYVATGLIIGAEKHHPFVFENASVYHELEFHFEEDSRKLIVCQEYTTNLLQKRGLQVPCTGQIQYIDDIIVFPPEYFCPYDHRNGIMNKTVNTVAIHHFASSWWDKNRKKAYRATRRLHVMHEITHFPNRLVKRLVGEHIYQKIKEILRKR